MKHIFIINSISGKGAGLKIAPIIDEVSKELSIDYLIKMTEKPDDARLFAQEYSEDPENIIYSVGGDGTLYEVLNGINRNSILGLIPAGSGNDFCRYFKENITDYRQTVRDVILAEPSYIDAGNINGKLFINTASIGIDAKINLDASKMIRKTFLTKGLAYYLSILMNIIILKPTIAKMTVDGKDYSGEYYIAACMNGRFYGNGVEASPLSLINDGLFNLVLFKKAPRFKTYSMLIKYLDRNHDNSKDFEIIECKNIEIESKDAMDCQSDGENFYSNRLSISILENYIRIKTPK